MLWPLQGTLHKSRPSLGALNLETSERSSAGLQPSAIRPQPSSLLPHCGQKRYEQNAHTPLTISLIFILFPYFTFFQWMIRTFFCFQQNSPRLQTSQTMPLPFLDIQHDSSRYHINRFRQPLSQRHIPLTNTPYSMPHPRSACSAHTYNIGHIHLDVPYTSA